MPGIAQTTYLEEKILAADPLELVCILYRGAADAVRSARSHLAERRIGDRGRAVSKALAILAELSRTLDHTGESTLGRSLAELYDYMQRRLLEANIRQADEPLAEVEGLLATLLEGWEQAWKSGQAAGTRQTGAGAGAPDVAGSYLPGALLASQPGYSAQSWSL